MMCRFCMFATCQRTSDDDLFPIRSMRHMENWSEMENWWGAQVWWGAENWLGAESGGYLDSSRERRLRMERRLWLDRRIWLERRVEGWKFTWSWEFGERVGDRLAWSIDICGWRSIDIFGWSEQQGTIIEMDCPAITKGSGCRHIQNFC